MIRNDREYEITKEQADHFAEALETADATNPGRSPAMQAVLKAALASQLGDLRRELAEYEQQRASIQNAAAQRAVTAVYENIGVLKNYIAASSMPLGIFVQQGARAACTSTSHSSVTMRMATPRSMRLALV